MKDKVLSFFVFLLVIYCSTIAFGAETDQYLTWGIELKDSADEINRYFNETLSNYLERVNNRAKPIDDPEELTAAVYYHFFQFLGWSQFRTHIRHDPDIQKYPDLSVGKQKYLRESFCTEGRSAF